MPNHSPSNQRHALYYEAILQLRPAPPKLLAYVYSFLEAKGVSIPRQEKLKTGIDMYLSSNRAALALGKRLKSAFPGKLVLSRALHSTDRQTSKVKYRVTVLFRLEQEDL